MIFFAFRWTCYCVTTLVWLLDPYFQRRAVMITVAVFWNILAGRKLASHNSVRTSLCFYFIIIFFHLQISAAPVLQTYPLKRLLRHQPFPCFPSTSVPFHHLFILLSTSFCLLEFPGKDVLIISCKNMIPVYSTEKNPIAHPPIGLGFSVE